MGCASWSSAARPPPRNTARSPPICHAIERGPRIPARGVRDLSPQRRERPLEIGARDDHGPSSPSHRPRVKPGVRNGHSARGRHVGCLEVRGPPQVCVGTTGARGECGMKTMVTTAGTGLPPAPAGADVLEPGAQGRTMAGRARARPRRHGRGLRGRPRGDRQARGAQDRPSPVDAGLQQRAHAARGQGRQPGRPPQHRRHLRDRQAGGRPAVHRHGAAVRPAARGPGRRGQAAPRLRDRRPAPGLRRADRRARRRRHPSRSQARQRVPGRQPRGSVARRGSSCSTGASPRSSTTTSATRSRAS